LREPAVGPDGRIAKRLLEREVESLEHSVYLRVVLKRIWLHPEGANRNMG
jgi:hypothetical protein